MITVILFLIILSVLVAAHEAGHLVVAKLIGAKVKEYAVGFPPRLFSKKIKGTDYSLNALPLGGYVSIAGEESADEEGEEEIPFDEKLANKHPLKRIAVLVAGVSANVVLAWVLLSISLMGGTYEAVPQNAPLPANARVVVLDVVANSPAQKAGLKPTDEIIKVTAGKNSDEPQTADELVNFLENNQDQKIALSVIQNGTQKEFTNIEAVNGITAGKKAIGIAVDTAVKKYYSFFPAFYKGIGVTGATIKDISVAGWQALAGIFHGKNGLSEIAGPVGIGKIVGEARSLGWVSVVTFAAFLSINLAIINILPFPALDGGRVVFALIEWALGKPLPPNLSRRVNTAGFVILMLLIVVVTIHDVVRLFS